MRVFLTGVLLTFIVIALISCATENVEVSFERLTIVKIDTVFRFGGNQLEITLQSKRGIDYISYTSIENHYIIGSSHTLMIRK